jgi:RNA recognition motif-containing protein
MRFVVLFFFSISSGEMKNGVRNGTRSDTRNEEESSKGSSTTVRWGKLPFETCQDDLREIVDIYHPESINFPLDILRKNRHRGYAFVKFPSLTETRNFVKGITHMKNCKGEAFTAVVVQDRCAEIVATKAVVVDALEEEAPDEETKVFVGGLGRLISEEMLYSYFDKFGLIKEVQIVRDKKSRVSRHFGFVTFKGPVMNADSLFGEHIYEEHPFGVRQYSYKTL